MQEPEVILTIRGRDLIDEKSTKNVFRPEKQPCVLTVYFILSELLFAKQLKEYWDMFGRRNRNNEASKPLSYDTEIELIFPAALFSDQIIAPMLKQVGIDMEAQGNKVMLFTDERTVAAINANRKIKELLPKARVGTVLYGWETEARSSFLNRELRSIAEKYAGDDEALSSAVFDLHRYVFTGMMGQMDPNPFAAPLPPLRPCDTFDLTAALAVMQSPEQINKPKAYQASR